LRCGAIFIDSTITNVLLIQKVKIFENQSMFDEVEAYEVRAYKKCASFFGPPCMPRPPTTPSNIITAHKENETP